MGELTTRHRAILTAIRDGGEISTTETTLFNLAKKGLLSVCRVTALAGTMCTVRDRVTLTSAGRSALSNSFKKEG